MRCVDIVHSYDELEYVSGCKELNADVFVIGEDWGKQPHNLAVESYLKSAGKQIKQVCYNPRTSSSAIKKNVRSQPYPYPASKLNIKLDDKPDIHSKESESAFSELLDES